MFLWCTSCQHFIGESQPLSDYALDYGLCRKCARNGPAHEPSAAPKAKELLARLIDAGEKGAFTRCDAIVAEALRFGMTFSDIFVGLLQPVLYDIGRRWERGEVGVADEHRVTAVCSRLLELLPPVDDPDPRADRPEVLLSPIDGNSHDIGVRLLARIAREAGHPCLLIYPGVPDQEIIELAWHRKSALVGISVAMADSIPAAVALSRRLKREIPGVRVVLGGYAFRMSPLRAVPSDVQALVSVDEFRRELAGLRQPNPAAPSKFR